MKNEKIEVRKYEIEGLGIFATRDMKKGETVIAWNPKLLGEEEMKGLPDREREHYLYTDGGKTFLMQPPERYINHSCSPNTQVVGMSDVALRDIRPGEEITTDYLGMGGFVCNCGLQDFRKTE